MRVININLESSSYDRIQLGYRNEENVTAVAFDFSPWYQEFGDGVISLFVKRSEDSVAYPVVVDQDDVGHIATWIVRQIDVNYPGKGSIEYFYVVGNQIKKSAVFMTYVDQDIGETGSDEVLQEPYVSYLERIAEMYAHMVECQRQTEAARDESNRISISLENDVLNITVRQEE